MGYHLNHIDEPVFMAGSKTLAEWVWHSIIDGKDVIDIIQFPGWTECLVQWSSLRVTSICLRAAWGGTSRTGWQMSGQSSSKPWTRQESLCNKSKLMCKREWCNRRVKKPLRIYLSMKKRLLGQEYLLSLKRHVQVRSYFRNAHNVYIIQSASSSSS